MSLHDFIFSNQKPVKYYRHIVFWTARLCFSMFWAVFFYSEEWRNWNKFVDESRFQVFNVFLAMAYCYLIIYVIYPRHLQKKKDAKYFTFIFALTTITYIIFYLGVYALWNIEYKPATYRMARVWRLTMYFITEGPPVVCCFFILIKMLKNYYFQMEKKSTLVVENANAELQLLKAQVHPHFLFNTLNNIYSFTLNQSPNAKGLLIKLSDTLKYMFNECEAPLVPLENELRMIENYLELEKIRYDERLHLTVSITGDAKNKLIAPLFLIPFVENSFKHGCSKMLKDPWIKMEIFIEVDNLQLELRNSKPLHVIPQNGKTGIGLKNVYKRLQLLYPNLHTLEIAANDEEYSVSMRIPLQQIDKKYVTEENARQITRANQRVTYVS